MTDTRDDGQRDAEALAERLRQRIRRDGALTFRDWMEAALYDAREGFYCRRDRARWGRAGDYRTSPETTPLFAATFAHYFAALFAELDAPRDAELDTPRDFTILEAGAGAGDFARVVLQTLERDFPNVYDATHYLVEEASDDARARAQSKLSSFGERVQFRRPDDAPPAPFDGLIFSNELLDALPVHRVAMRGGQLLELGVGLDAGGAFVWVERAPSTPRLAAHFARAGISLVERQLAEVNLEAEDWMARAAGSMRRGYVVTVDYGAEAAELYDASARPEGSLRAFQRHQLGADLLAEPGTQDLTTTVNWTQLRSAGERAGLETVLFARLDEFLLRAGLLEQLQRMTDAAPDEAERMRLRLGAREMILPGGMSRSFQVLVQKR